MDLVRCSCACPHEGVVFTPEYHGTEDSSKGSTLCTAFSLLGGNSATDYMEVSMATDANSSKHIGNGLIP